MKAMMQAGIAAVAFGIAVPGCGAGEGNAVLISSSANIVNGAPTGDELNNVGMLLGRTVAGGPWRFMHCSGVLISHDVFLTAGHCIATKAGFVVQWGVSFAPDMNVTTPVTAQFPIVDQTLPIIPGVGHYNPAWDPKAADPAEMSVVVLDEPVVDRKFAKPEFAGYLDAVASSGDALEVGLAGYGITTFDHRVGGKLPFDGGIRRASTGILSAVHSATIDVLPDPGSICGNDSGGPGFLLPQGNHDGVPAYVKKFHSINISVLAAPGVPTCQAGSILYRIDTPAARAYIGQFVPSFLEDDQSEGE